MLSLIIGLVAAILAILRNLFQNHILGLISFILGIVAWIVGDRILEERPNDKIASMGRMIGVISTVMGLTMLALLIRTFIKGGAA